jgi:Ulp1 family protease
MNRPCIVDESVNYRLTSVHLLISPDASDNARPIVPYPSYQHHPSLPVSQERLVIRQQRRTLLVLAHNLSTGEGITSQQSRHTNRNRQHEQQPRDREGEDVLQLQNMRACKHLSETRSCGFVSPSASQNAIPSKTQKQGSTYKTP